MESSLWPVTESTMPPQGHPDKNSGNEAPRVFLVGQRSAGREGDGFETLKHWKISLKKYE